MIKSSYIADLHKKMVQKWHESEELEHSYTDIFEIICEQHKRNYHLWHEEDKARDQKALDSDIARVKRNIDKFNQQRNDLIEKIDDCIISILESKKIKLQPDAKINSETPGSIIDRLSILSLRIYHMEEQACRKDTDQDHRRATGRKLEILKEQLKDLLTSLDELIDDIFSGKKRMKVYRQFKMYNDPKLNPYLYR